MLNTRRPAAIMAAATDSPSKAGIMSPSTLILTGRPRSTLLSTLVDSLVDVLLHALKPPKFLAYF